MPGIAAWLPESALAGARTAEPVIACLREWSDHWSAEPLTPHSTRWRKSPPNSRLRGEFDSTSSSAGFAVQLRKKRRLALASALLGRAVEERDVRTGQDRCVIDHLVQAALGDLALRLKTALPALPDWQTPLAEGGGSYLIEFGPGDAPLLRIEAAPGVLAGIARAAAGKPRERSRPHPPHRVLESTQLRLAAMIGTSRFPLAEFEALAVGDVLTLDTPLSAPAAACLNGQRRGEAALSLVPRDDGFLIQIERPASQW